MPAISAPPNSRRTWMSWIVLPVTVQNTAPMLPTMPACSQCEIWLLRTMWWPMFSFDQPLLPGAFDRLDVALRRCSAEVLSNSSPCLPSVMPVQTE